MKLKNNNLINIKKNNILLSNIIQKRLQLNNKITQITLNPRINNEQVVFADHGVSNNFFDNQEHHYPFEEKREFVTNKLGFNFKKRNKKKDLFYIKLKNKIKEDKLDNNSEYFLDVNDPDNILSMTNVLNRL